MKVGFTGTRDGMADAQFVRFRQCFSESHAGEFHHGCCVGADEDAALQIADSYALLVKIVGHPSDIASLTSAEAVRRSHQTLPARPALERNRDIVDACDLLIACPKGPEERRSGTWATIRYARKVGRPVVIVWPDGTSTEERNSG
jgi:hypothetical protein